MEALRFKTSYFRYEIENYIRFLRTTLNKIITMITFIA